MTVAILIEAVVHNSRSVRKRIGNEEKIYSHVCSLHIPMKSMVIYTDLLMARRGGVTIEKGKTRRPKKLGLV